MLTNTAQCKPTPKIDIKFILIIGLFAVIGLFLSFTQLGAYGGKDNFLAQNSWLCGGSGDFEYGCNGVFASRYGKILGIPLPLFGSLYFLSILFWLAIFQRDSLNMFFGVLLALGAIISLGLLYVLFFVLPGMCNWCLLIHLSNFLMIITALIGFFKQGKFFDFSFFSYRITKAFLVLFIMLTLTTATAAFYFYYQTSGLKNAYLKIRLNPGYQECLYESEETHEIVIQPNDHILGSTAAPVQIVIYKDAQCEFCHKAWDMLKQIYNKFNLDKMPRVAIILRQYPLSSRCNTHIQRNMHPYACPAARAMEAVSIVGGDEAFWKYNELLQQHHKELDTGPFMKLAKEIGLSEKSISAALKKTEIDEKIKFDTDSLFEMGYLAVPIIFINGKYVDGWQVEGFMEKIVEKLLKQSRWPTATQEATAQPASIQITSPKKQIAK